MDKSDHCNPFLKTEHTLMSLDQKYLELADLKAKAKKRLPKFVWEYLDSATGRESALPRNREAFDRLLFTPSILHGESNPDLSVSLFGQGYALPFGVAPVGMSGLIWPNAERHLARTAAELGFPFCLSTVAAETPEAIAEHHGGHGWFQLYPPRDPEIRDDIMRRAKDAGFKTLVLTADLPAASRRERQTRSGLKHPPKLTPRLMAQVAIRPEWAMARLLNGMPRMKTLEPYIEGTMKNLPPTAHAGYMMRVAPDWEYLQAVREYWDGPLIVKGVLNPEDAPKLQSYGVDGIWVSNHAGRQFDGAPASIDVLPMIRAQTDLPIIFDSGIEGGLDIMRAMALGADMVMLGRAWHYALAALGSKGPALLADILRKDLMSCMGQIGVNRPSQAAKRLITEQRSNL